MEQSVKKKPAEKCPEEKQRGGSRSEGWEKLRLAILESALYEYAVLNGMKESMPRARWEDKMDENLSFWKSDFAAVLTGVDDEDRRLALPQSFQSRCFSPEEHLRAISPLGDY